LTNSRYPAPSSKAPKNLFLFGLGYGDFYRGDWASARAYLRRAEAASRATPSWCAPYPLMALGQLSLAEGAWEAATGYLEESLIPAEAIGDVQALRNAQSLLAERDLLDGRPEAVITRLSPLLDRPGLEEISVTEILPPLAWARLELGEHAAAREIVQQSVARARARRYRLILVDALRVQGLVALRQKCWLEAARPRRGPVDSGKHPLSVWSGARAPHIWIATCGDWRTGAGAGAIGGGAGDLPAPRSAPRQRARRAGAVRPPVSAKGLWMS